jgi:osmotically-inducible protein OsmY
MFGADWTDATLYAVTLNTARVAPDDCVSHIASLAESETFRPTPASLGRLNDRLVEARVRSALRNRFDASLGAMGVDVRVQDGQVVLVGAASDERIIADLVRTAAAVPGAIRVQSQIRYISFVRDSL